MLLCAAAMLHKRHSPFRYTDQRPTLAAAVLFLTVAVLSFRCQSPPSDGEPKPAADRQGAPDIARVVCDADGTRILTPKVAAQRDGLHLVIDNRLEGDYGFSVETPEGGGGGDNASKGESRHVFDSIPPGEARIGCYESRKDMEPDYATVEILKSDSGYRSVNLECRGGAAVMGEGGLLAPGAKGEKGEPVELARRALKDRLREDDTLELADYPESVSSRSVRVVREGRVITAVSYRKEATGWFENSTTNCANL